MRASPLALCVLALHTALAAVYSEQWQPYNLNTNPDPTADVLAFSGKWEGHTFTPSPANWRELPTYTLILDKWLDGQPQRNEALGEGEWEWNLMANQLRHGGDVQGVLSASGRSLDYLQSMGVRCVYIAGTPYINMPWGADGYSPLDFSILDPHTGTIDDWRMLITELHARNMSIIIDMTVGTLADFVGFEGYLNISTPFSVKEHTAVWKEQRYGPFKEYPDFKFSNVYNESCTYPQFWNEDGSVATDGPQMGCYDSEFDQYGDTEAFGVHPDWQRELSKFASVQDRLREWKPSVMEKLKVFACLSVQMLDVDGIRIDKATQMTVDALAEWASSTRQCAAALGKHNFFIPGEITGGNTFGSIYLGRGRTPQQVPDHDGAIAMSPKNSSYFLRPEGMVALDSAAFHYSVYRSLTRFLGMDGNLEVAYDVQVNFVDAWNVMLTSNDMINPATGAFDPRHLFGVTNQDVFRWPSLQNGTSKALLGSFITTMLLPGIPLIFYGEEQELYLYDSTAANYLFGRQPMGSNVAWQAHGCYSLGSSQYYNMPFEAALNGCHDDWNSLDHLDPTTPSRLVMARMNYLRTQYPALQDGLNLYQRGNWTSLGELPGSNHSTTEWGVWSVERNVLPVQQLTGAYANVSVWLIYSNMNVSQELAFDCETDADAIISPFQAGITVRNLLYPYQNATLVDSPTPYYLDGKAPYRGCMADLQVPKLGFQAWVPTQYWDGPLPFLSGFSPGHDARIMTNEGNATSFDIMFEYTTPMSCESVTAALTITAETSGSTMTPTLNTGSVQCGTYENAAIPPLVGAPASLWWWSGTITNARDGVYLLNIGSVTSADGLKTPIADHLLLRKGTAQNVVVFPNATANYDASLLTENNGAVTINHKALGATMFRYSTDFEITWSVWAEWESSTVIPSSAFNATADTWEGTHVAVQYYSNLAASSAHIVTGDLGWAHSAPRLFPDMYLKGPFNDFGYDKGLNSRLRPNSNGSWSIDMMVKWGAYFQVSPYIEPEMAYYGDVDGDRVLDKLQPTTQAGNYVNFTAPHYPHLAYTLTFHPETYSFTSMPRGSAIVQIVMFVLLALIPIITAIIAVYTYKRMFYTVTYNRIGAKEVSGLKAFFAKPAGKSASANENFLGEKAPAQPDAEGGDLAIWPDDPSARRKVLIATLEYEIFGMNPPVKVKIGGLGVMSGLMGKAMSDVDLIWVIPKIGDLVYQPMTPTEPISVKIFDEYYSIVCETHRVDNILYYVLDSPVFRKQTKADPYPARMDDLESAIFYSTWNQCVAEVMRRTPNLSIYHMNDYHATLAPLYLLPKVIPVCLSLHNAEFQGLWPLRTPEERKEIAGVFNMDPEITEKYVQFGNTMNLLHAGAEYIAIHQHSTGCAGVSEKYGKRSWSRYPALWTLKSIDSLPNPDPSDIADLDAQPIEVRKISVDREAEAKRPGFRREAQEWAGLNVDPEADLFVFVGRWSKQKGVDLIADVFPAVLEKNSSVQLITIGPVIDLYGRFAATKLARLMELYPGRVYSKPEFTALPPFIFSGAEFALIPSRDEPFGLVAVEFGRKGALGVGSRLGGLGLAPGWWFNVESDSTAHMHSQFQKTIKAALKSSKRERAILRARSAVQRFPVLEWRQRSEDFHKRSILASRKYAKESARYAWDSSDSKHSYPPLAKTGSRRPADLLPISNFPASLDSPAINVQSPYGHSPYGQSPAGFDQSQSFLNDQERGGGRNSSFDSPYGAHHNQSAYGQGDLDADSIASGYFGEQHAHADLAEAGGHFYPHTPTFQTPPGTPGSPAMDDIPYGDGSFLDRANTMLERKITRKGGRRMRDPLFASSREDPRDENSTGFRTPKRPTFAAGPSVASLAEADEETGALDAPRLPFGSGGRRDSSGSISEILSEKSASPLNVVMASFLDEDGAVAQQFSEQMASLDSKNSTSDEYSVEQYLIKQEKVFFDVVRKEKRDAAKATLREASGEADSIMESYYGHEHSVFDVTETVKESGPATVAPTRVKLFMLKLVFGSWPVYCIVLALGQTLGATSFQLVLIGGSSTQSNASLYIIGCVYLASTLCWWALYQYKSLVYVLSLPFFFFAAAFIVISLPIAITSFQVSFIRYSVTLAATCIYAFASAAGFAYFAFNFGEEAGVQTSAWVFRACVVQGSQTIWIAALWYWGFKLSGKDSQASIPSKFVLAGTIPLAAICIALGLVAFFGLPDFYRQKPGHITNFTATLLRRKIVVWFLVSQFLSLYWLSSPYGRNWSFLWQSGTLETWVVVILAAFFFIVVWGVILTILSRMSKEHTWILPIFAVGLGAPRWCQMIWGTSGIALYLPWAGAAGPYLSTSLWLWLGVLDSLQGIGLGMMLLQTLSRTHVAAAMAAAQVIGSVVTMLARATSPDKDGPGRVFPCFGLWNPHEGLGASPFAYWEFWLGFACQIVIVFGYLWLFRKEQLSSDFLLMDASSSSERPASTSSASVDEAENERSTTSTPPKIVLLRRPSSSSSVVPPSYNNSVFQHENGRGARSKSEGGTSRLAAQSTSSATASGPSSPENGSEMVDRLAIDREVPTSMPPNASTASIMADTTLPPPLDPTLLAALNHPRDRMMLLRAEVEMEGFLADASTSRLPLQPPHFPALLNSYQRLLLHRLADIFGITREVEPVPLRDRVMIQSQSATVVLVKGTSTRIPAYKLESYAPSPPLIPAPASQPPPPLAQQNVTPQQTPTMLQTSLPAIISTASPTAHSPAPPLPPQVFKILPRSLPAHHPSSSASSSTSNSSSSLPSVSTSTSKERREMTLEERELAYKEARERIFAASAASSSTSEGPTRPSSAGSSVSHRSSAALSSISRLDDSPYAHSPQGQASGYYPSPSPSNAPGRYFPLQSQPGMLPNALRPSAPSFDPAAPAWHYGAPSGSAEYGYPPTQYTMDYGGYDPRRGPPPVPSSQAGYYSSYGASQSSQQAGQHGYGTLPQPIPVEMQHPYPQPWSRPVPSTSASSSSASSSRDVPGSSSSLLMRFGDGGSGPGTPSASSSSSVDGKRGSASASKSRNDVVGNGKRDGEDVLRKPRDRELTEKATPGSDAKALASNGSTSSPSPSTSISATKTSLHPSLPAKPSWVTTQPPSERDSPHLRRSTAGPANMPPLNAPSQPHVSEPQQSNYVVSFPPLGATPAYPYPAPNPYYSHHSHPSPPHHTPSPSQQQGGPPPTWWPDQSSAYQPYPYAAPPPPHLHHSHGPSMPPPALFMPPQSAPVILEPQEIRRPPARNPQLFDPRSGGGGGDAGPGGKSRGETRRGGSPSASGLEKGLEAVSLGTGLSTGGASALE